MALARQIWTLTAKNLKIVVLRHSFATVIRAFLLPIVIAVFVSYARNFSVPPSYYGISAARPVRPLSGALPVAADVGRDTVVFVNGGHAGGAIDRVIDDVAAAVAAAGKNATRLSDAADLGYVCRSTLRGVTGCYGAVVFASSPGEGPGGIWNYTLRADGSLGGKPDVRKDTNDGEIYTLPLQRAVDAAIAGVGGGGGSGNTTTTTTAAVKFPETTDEYMYTPKTEAEYQTWIRELYQSSISNFMAVLFIIIMIGVCYHMTGLMATEREIGMAQLIDAMMPTRHPWQAQAARLLSYHLAFTIIYVPGWVIGAIIVWAGVFASSSAAIIIVYFVLSGLAFASLAILGAAFFKKSQLSGVVTTIAYLLLAILAQSLTSPGNGTVAALSLLFTPCNFVWFMTWVARFEKTSTPSNLARAGPDSPWTIPGIVLWVFIVIQIFAYPLLGAYLERVFHGSTTKGRAILHDQGQGQPGGDTDAAAAVRLEDFTKIYAPNPLRRLFNFALGPKESVVAVDRLTLRAGRGQILALLGANGSGKSTTLDSIAGTSRLTSGHITIDGTGGLGIAPQKNVMWDELSVYEHIHVFNRLKSARGGGATATASSTRDEIRQLVESIDLGPKLKARSKTLSGGQKRKLQLGMMLTGGSAVCCVDEVSSGIDPLSRRKIWDILLAERGRRTIILTTHFLDEADLLADHIAILSKGSLRASGSSVELKDRLGAGYRIHVPNGAAFASTTPTTNGNDNKEGGTLLASAGVGGAAGSPSALLPEVDGVQKKPSFDVVSYMAPSSALAAQVIRELERAGVRDYKFSGPTIEDVFLQVAEEVRGENLGEPGTLPSGLAGVGVGAGAAASLGAADDSSEEDHAGAADGQPPVKEGKHDEFELLEGQRIGFLRQTWVLFLKRCTVFKTNWFPCVAAFCIPIVAAALTSLYVQNQAASGCTPADQSALSGTGDFGNLFNDISIVAGPSSKLDILTLLRLFLPVYGTEFGGVDGSGGSMNATGSDVAGLLSGLGGDNGTGISTDVLGGLLAQLGADGNNNNNPLGALGSDPVGTLGSLANLTKSLHFVDTLDEFNAYLVANRKNVTPGGFWAGDATTAPLVAYEGDIGDVLTSVFVQNALDMVLANASIAATYSPFDLPFSPSAGNSLNLLIYFSLALCAAPAFFGLYPNVERRRHVRALQFSNGVRSLPLWLAHLAFDFGVTALSMLVTAAVFAAASPVWYAVGYLFLVLPLYGLASALLAYLISQFCRSQLSTYAFAAGQAAVGFLVYFIAFYSVNIYAAADAVESDLLVVHFVVAAVFPVGSLFRAMFVALNLFSTSCEGYVLAPNPAGITRYGGPILYLIVQSLFLFGVLLLHDSGAGARAWGRLTQRRLASSKGGDSAAAAAAEDEEVAHERARIEGTGGSSSSSIDAAAADEKNQGLQVVHLTKSFGRNTAVDNVTFGVPHGEVFALLGPNGAGKSTTISMIRGDLQPSPGGRSGGGGGGGGSDVLVEGVSAVGSSRAAARRSLGVCPQFDAVDQMTVLEHLRFYARVRGVPDVDHNVAAVLRAVGLGPYAGRAASALSGGNKRKLSLGIALMGNPSVVLLDEPSSGLDAAAKRVMWRTLSRVAPGRSILLTTHSMEEADALAGRAGILAGRMLALGTIPGLRRRFGDALHVHLVSASAPHSTDEEMDRLRAWVVARFPAARVEAKTYHGQMRFSIPASAVTAAAAEGEEDGGGKRGSSVAVREEEGGEQESDAEIAHVAETSTSTSSAVGRLVVALDEAREDLGIEHYSVSPTTLDQVFLTIVGQHRIQEEGYKEEKKKPWWRKGW